MKYLLGLYFIVLLLFTCSSPSKDEQMPNVFVNLNISLLDPNYAIPLDKGFKYISNVGAKGILLYRESSTSYIAFERTCTYKPSLPCEMIEVDSSLLFIKDKCCNSFYRFDGNPFSGPAYRPLLRYNTTILGQTLYITN